MTHQKILTKAIKKARKNGWRGLEEVYQQTIKHTEWQLVKDPWFASTNDIIFNQEFAKALWGKDKSISVYPAPSLILPKWKYHLQQMVINENPIKYLGENL